MCAVGRGGGSPSRAVVGYTGRFTFVGLCTGTFWSFAGMGWLSAGESAGLQSEVVSALAVEFTRVSKSYSIYRAPGDRLKELATFHRRQFHQDYWALRDVSFEVVRGETFCIVGENGCGKSTLLQICAGILQPTSGTINVNGRIAALLELGTGFNPEFTGRDNVYLNAAILGFSTKEMDRKFADIAEFAEIGDFINQPVKTYSSGMAVRLAFA